MTAHASSPQIKLNDKPRSNEPLYSLPFMPKPTSSDATTEPHSRVRYASVCVEPRRFRGSRRAYCTVSASAHTSANIMPHVAMDSKAA